MCLNYDANTVVAAVEHEYEFLRKTSSGHLIKKPVIENKYKTRIVIAMVAINV